MPRPPATVFSRGCIFAPDDMRQDQHWYFLPEGQRYGSRAPPSLTLNRYIGSGSVGESRKRSPQGRLSMVRPLLAVATVVPCNTSSCLNPRQRSSPNISPCGLQKQSDAASSPCQEYPACFAYPKKPAGAADQQLKDEKTRCFAFRPKQQSGV